MFKLATNEIRANFYALNLYPLGVFGGKEKGSPHPKSAKNEKPCLLVHGIVHNPSAFFKIKRKMDERGWQNIFTINYSTRHGSFFKMVEELSRRVDKILAETQAGEIDIVAHSLGGIVARLYMTGIGRGKIRNLITLGTPHLGTGLSFLLRGFYAGTLKSDLRAGSGFLKDLENRKIPLGSQLISIYTPHDILVWPRKNCQAIGFPKKCISNIEMEKIGHMGLLYDDQVLNTVIKNLTR